MFIGTLLIAFVGCGVDQSVDQNVALNAEKQSELVGEVLAEAPVASVEAIDGVLQSRLRGDGKVLYHAQGATLSQSDSEVSFRLARAGERVFETVSPTLSDCLPHREKFVRTAEYQRPDITEWWAGHENGAQHGFVVHNPIQDEGLDLEVDLDGATITSVKDQRIQFVDNAGKTWDYRVLLAWDATGRELPTALSGADATIVLSIDDNHAEYPIVIDPVIEDPIYFTFTRPIGPHSSGRASVESYFLIGHDLTDV
jgi:hypothetical protein